MEEARSVASLSRKELRKQKLMEYLAAKGKLKDSDLNAKSSAICGDSVLKKPLSSKVVVASGKENKPPADRFGHKQKKYSTQSSVKPPPNVLGVNRRVNVQGGVQTGQRGALFKCATNGSTQLPLKPAVKKSETTLLPARSHPRNRSTSAVQSSARLSSKSGCAAVSISASRSCSGARAAWSCPLNTAGSRISLGCLVKTRTGLVPAVTQSSHHAGHSLVRPCASATNTSAPRTAAADRSSHKTTSTSLAAAAQKSSALTALSKAARDQGVLSTAAAATAAAGGNRKPKVLAQPGTRPPLQKTSGLKSSTSSTAAHHKIPATVTTSHQSDRRPMETFTRRTLERKGSKNSQQINASSQLSCQVAASRSRGDHRSAATAAAANTVKEKSSIHTQTKKQHSLVNSRPPQNGLRKIASSVTVPWPPRITSHPCRTAVTTATKTPAPMTTKVRAKIGPQTEGARLTVAQEERMKKLREWQEAKGICYKRPPMQVRAQVKPPEGALPPCGKDQVDSLICTVDRSLSDCIKLLEEGSPPEQVRPILSRLPAVCRKFTKFWICQARLMEREGNLDVLPMFKEAVGVVLEPLDELRTVVFEILKKKEELPDGERAEEQSPGGERSAELINNLLATPKPLTELISGEKGNSSVIKYKVTTTPGRPPRQPQEPRRFNGQELRFLTPVRRSVRIHRASVNYPESLRDHDLCVSSYGELLGGVEVEDAAAGGEEDTPLYVYVGNEALGDEVSVQLLSSAPAESASQC